MMKMNRVFLIIITSSLMLITTDAIGDDFCAELKDFYSTKLFAIETHLSILTNIKDTTLEREEEIAILKGEKEIIKRRLKACERYSRHNYLSKIFYKNLGRNDINFIVEKKARKYGVNPQLIKSIIKAESNYQIHARSRAGAMGLMQLMPETAEDMGVEDPWDPGENIEGGTKYFTLLLKEFNNLKDALVAYNSGPNRVRNRRKIYPETRRYVRNVLAYYNKSR